MLIEFFITFIKTIFFNLCTSFTFFKIKQQDNITKKIVLLIIIFNIIIGIVYGGVYIILEQHKINIAISNLICYIIYIALVSFIIDGKITEKIIYSIISISISFISLVIAGIVNFIIIKVILESKIYINILENTIIEYTNIGVIQFILLWLFFRIKRFKNGLSFLKSNASMKTIKLIGIFISIAIIFINVIIAKQRNNLIERMLFTGIILGIILTINWIRSSITKFYKERMKDRTVEIQAEQLKEKDEIISNLKQELSNVLEINHKYNRRLSAMERAVAKFGNKLSFDEELANEYSDVLDSLRDLSKEYKQEFDNYCVLPKTNIFSIDNLLEYMKVEALKSNIEFKLELNCEISEMIEKHISKNKLETLLSDHISDSIIAINSSDSANRKIKVIIGKIGEFYEVSILDTGIEFKIETLLKLGLERVTTHKDSGGSGIGFMTTFETLSDCRASLIIEEHDKEKDNYTKTVVVRFDNKNEYKVISARAEEIKKKDFKNRIIVV